MTSTSTKRKAEEMAVTMSATPGRVTRSAAKSLGSEFFMLPDTRKKMQKEGCSAAEVEEGYGAEVEKAEEEEEEEEVNPRNLEDVCSPADVEKEEQEVNSKKEDFSVAEFEKEEKEVNPKDIQEGCSATGVEKAEEEVNPRNIHEGCSAAEGGKAEEEKSKNLQEGLLVEGESSTKVLECSAEYNEKEMEDVKGPGDA